MCAAPLTEFTLETVLRDGLGELRANPDRLDDIFGKFLEAQFLNQYGQSKINELKTYIANNQIRIVHSLSMVPTSMPCLSIRLVRADESEEMQNLGNNFMDQDESKDPTIFVPIVTPASYNVLTKKLTISNPADLSAVCKSMNFVDKNGTIFSIKAPISNLSGNKFITLDTNGEPDITGNGRIESSIDFTRIERRMIRLRETISIGCHSSDDIHLSKFLYYILTYILKSRQESLITRGIELDRGTGNIFDREGEFDGENVFSRYVDFNCLTEFVWNQSEVQVFDCFDLTVKTNVPKPESEEAENYNSSPTG